MLTVAIIPCYNEQDFIINTAVTLGFAKDDLKKDPSEILILINNRSTDKTEEKLNYIRAHSLPGTVLIIEESIKGYVPARQSGIRVLEKYLSTHKIDPAGVFICQGDADTLYSENYLQQMRKKAEKHGTGFIYSALVEHPAAAITGLKEYLQLADKVDAEFTELNDAEGYDYIVDDKACGYWFSEYKKWGGLQREYKTSGFEFYAETTCLYLRSLVHGTGRIFNENARVMHSPRRILENPLLQFATAGFPREKDSAVRQYFEQPEHNLPLSFFVSGSHPLISKASEFRRLYIKALFVLLPIHIHIALSGNQRRIIPYPERSVNDLVDKPSQFILDVFVILGI